MFEIRSAATEAEFSEFRSLCLEYAQSLSFELCFQDFDREMRSLPGPYARPRGEILLLTTEGVTAGCVALKPILPTGMCEMKRLWVRPPFRRRGYGSALVEALIRAAGAAGYHTLRLDTIRNMKPAIRLYESLGFREVAAYTHNPIADAAYFELALNRTTVDSAGTEP